MTKLVASLADLGQTLDEGNTAALTAADCSPGNPWVGDATVTRAARVVDILLTCASDELVAGWITFEFSEDGFTWVPSIRSYSRDFRTVRYRALRNTGALYRAQFEPEFLLGSATVFVKSELSRQAGPEFVVPAGHRFEESNAAFGVTWALLRGFGDDGLDKIVRATALGDLRVSDERLSLTESGSLDVESIRDDISLSFSRDSGAASIADDLNDLSSGGSAAHDTTQGRVVFSTTGTAGRTAYFESNDHARYEAGHMIRGEQTIEVSPALAGTAKVEWGFGEDDGSGDVLNGLGWGMDAAGLYVWRRKAGVYEAKTYQEDFNRDMLSGEEPTRFRTSGGPVAFDSTKNSLYLTAFEWLGIAPPFYRLQAPLGEFVTAHVEETSNRIDGTTIPEPELPMFVRVSNGDQAVDYAVACGSWRGGIYTSQQIPPTIGDPQTAQFTVTSSSVMVIDRRSGRKSVALGCRSDSARSLVYGFTAGVTVSSGFELPPGAVADRGWGPKVQVWVIQAGGSGTVTACVDDGA